MGKIINFLNYKKQTPNTTWTHDCPVSGFQLVVKKQKCFWCDMSFEDEIKIHEDYHESYKKRKKFLSKTDIEKFFKF